MILSLSLAPVLEFPIGQLPPARPPKDGCRHWPFINQMQPFPLSGSSMRWHSNLSPIPLSSPHPPHLSMRPQSLLSGGGIHPKNVERQSMYGVFTCNCRPEVQAHVTPHASPIPGHTGQPGMPSGPPSMGHGGPAPMGKPGINAMGPPLHHHGAPHHDAGPQGGSDEVGMYHHHM